VVVLGHQRCGAVTDTIALVDAGESAPASIQRIVEAIAPVVRATPRRRDFAGYVDQVVAANARAVADGISGGSQIIGAASEAERVRVVAAVYSLDSGAIELL
jgi:carbonic anhydrase